MKISNQNNNITFKHKKIGTVNLLKLKNGEKTGIEKALISIFEDNNTEDAKIIGKLQELWTQYCYKLPPREALLSKTLTEDICNNFISLNVVNNLDKKALQAYSPSPPVKRVFLAIEKEGEDVLEKRVLGLMNITEEETIPKRLKLNFLVVNPLLISKNIKREIAGIGETLFTKIVQIAEKKGYRDISWSSENNSFYLDLLKKRKIDSDKVHVGGVSFVLPQRFFNSFLDYFDGKYKMNFSSAPIEKELSYFDVSA